MEHSREDLIEVLQAPLKSGVEYYDATPSIEELCAKIQQLEGFITMQLRINQRILEQLMELQPPTTSLILPDRLNN